MNSIKTLVEYSKHGFSDFSTFLKEDTENELEVKYYEDGSIQIVLWQSIDADKYYEEKERLWDIFCNLRGNMMDIIESDISNIEKETSAKKLIESAIK